METNCLRPKWFDPNELIRMRCKFGGVWLNVCLLYWFPLIVLFVWNPMNLVYREPIAIDQLDDLRLILSFFPNFDTWSDNWFECYFEVKRSYFVWLLLRKNVAKTKTLTKYFTSIIVWRCDWLAYSGIQILLAPISLQLSWILSLFFWGVQWHCVDANFELLFDKQWFIENWRSSLRRTLPQRFKRRRDLQTWAIPFLAGEKKNNQNKTQNWNQSIHLGYLSFQNVLFALFIPNKLFALRINQQIGIRLLSARISCHLIIACINLCICLVSHNSLGFEKETENV